MPNHFKYELDKPPFVETWGQGLVVFLNPNAKNPLPHDYFVDAAQEYLENGKLLSDIPPVFHPYSSKTYTFASEERPIEVDNGNVDVITKRMFTMLIGNGDREIFNKKEIAWYSNKDRSLIATIILDMDDGKCGFIILRKEDTGYEQCYYRKNIMEYESVFKDFIAVINDLGGK